MIDGGKVKAELASVGEVGAKSLDGLAQRSQQAAQAVNQLRTHEVTNLAAQLTDMGVQVLSGQSFMTAIIQQGPQMAAVLGDRGLKASLVGAGAAMASLVTPTTAVLAGVAALGYGASIALDAITSDTEEASDRLEKHEEIVRRIAERYGDVEEAAKAVSVAQRQIDLAQAAQNADAMRRLYRDDIGDLLGGISQRSVIVGTAGDIAQNPLFESFADAVARLSEEARSGEPDIEAFRGEVSRLINETDDPAVRRLGYDLLDMSEAAAKSGEGLDIASRAAERVATSFGLSAEAVKQFRSAMKEFDGNRRVLEEIERSIDAAGDGRQQAINRAVDRLKNPDEETLKEVREAAGRAYDVQQAQREQEKRSREALSESRRRQNAVESEAERIYRQTRTAAEEYADTLEKLNEHLQAGRIDQETYARAVAAADEVMREANRAALDAATDAASGYKRAVRDYVESAQDMAQTTEDLMVNALGSAEDAFVEFVTTGKTEFGDLVNSMIADLARLAFRQSVAGLLSGSGGDFLGNLITGAVNMLSGGLTGGGSGNAAGYMASGYVNDNTFGGPRAMGGQIKEGFDYLVGEKGPEVVTARRDGFVLPTEALRGAAPVNNVRIINQVSGAEVVPGPARRNSSGGVDQEFTVRRMVRDEIRAAVSDGDLDDVGAARYNWRRGDLG
ncbi:phage tail tape measure C-terminal domain-containing protein [Ancylobacter moscoviensis]